MFQSQGHYQYEWRNDTTVQNSMQQQQFYPQEIPSGREEAPSYVVQQHDNFGNVAMGRGQQLTIPHGYSSLPTSHQEEAGSSALSLGRASNVSGIDFGPLLNAQVTAEAGVLSESDSRSAVQKQKNFVFSSYAPPSESLPG